MRGKGPKAYWTYVNSLNKAQKPDQLNVEDFYEFLKISTPRLIRMMSPQLPNFPFLIHKMILIMKSPKKKL